MRDEFNITTIDEVINQLGNHLGSWIFEDGKLKDDVLAIDTRELLKEFKPMEVDIDTAKEICNGLVEIHGDDMYSMFNDFSFGGIATKSDNTYNWGSVLSHDLNINEFIYNDTKYVAIMVHLGGDIRGNYSYYIILECDFDDLFEVEFYPTIEVNQDMVADLRWYSDTYSVYNHTTQEDVGEYYETELADLLEAIEKEKNAN